MTSLSNFINQVKKNNPAMKTLLESQEHKRSRLVFKHRMNLGLSQTELAKRANVTQKTISRIEGADTGIRESTLEKVFEVLQISDEETSAAKELAVH